MEEECHVFIAKSRVQAHFVANLPTHADLVGSVTVPNCRSARHDTGGEFA